MPDAPAPNDLPPRVAVLEAIASATKAALQRIERGSGDARSTHR